MKNMVHLVLTLSLAVCLANCGAAREPIQTESLTGREGIFQEVTTAGGPPPGFADVVLTACLKTHLPGEGPWLESRNSPHGGPFYHFTVDVDGQKAAWKVPGQRENLPVAPGRHSQDEGDGIKYGLEKRIRLQAGTHRIIFGVPEEDYAETVTVNLREGQSYALEFRPVYPRYKWGHPAFQLGFLGFDARFRDTL